MSDSDPTPIKIPYPKVNDLQLKITAPVCSVSIAPGIGNAWVNGVYFDPKEVAPLGVTHSGDETNIIAVSAVSYRAPRSYIPRMKLSFGRSKPFSLAITAGNQPAHFDFGGVPLKSLEIRYGASDQVIDFSYPNPEPMHDIRVAADACLIQIENLANANAEEVRLGGDSTKYRLNFGGELKRNTAIHIGIPVKMVDIFIPANTAVKVISSNNPNASNLNDFIYEDNAYWNEPARNHQEPLLYIHSMAAYGKFHLHFV